ncbi:methylmalonyl Co-A mutase-associated GTPase MeaB [Acrocarpospora catenulata]|uniref:methylmalonyl Co-A mutase-associated GTPase MeaB n=1 Tax=Acrocarpospora catenulata TaxID=2836182 RepID=UPI001BDA2898|nr:methylmalonyl Co-A mutase-associated GTPase MeaB [Acrocarpospora catenulata]
MSAGDLAEGVLRGEVRAVARAISLVENAGPGLRALTEELVKGMREPYRARVVGLTGAPGVGKSTSTGTLIEAARARGERVAVLAVDPSSPFTGGALLGDRVRMQAHATDPGVFIRSMATRGHLGGLAWAAPQAIRVLDAAGYDLILVETVGVGQAEVDIASLADSTIVLLAPGMGDSVQAAKAGILEIADVFVVNKADRDGAQETVRDLRNMVALSGSRDWRPPIVSTVAARGEGAADLVAALDRHAEHLAASGEGRARRLARARDEIEAIVLTGLRARMGEISGDRHLDALAEALLAAKTDPYRAADQVIAAL